MTTRAPRLQAGVLPLALGLLGAQVGLCARYAPFAEGAPFAEAPCMGRSGPEVVASSGPGSLDPAGPSSPGPATPGPATPGPATPVRASGDSMRRQDLERVRALIGEGELVQAVLEAEALPEDLDGRVARVESRYWAGDLSGAMAAVRAALPSHPQDPQLLLLASELSTQLLLPEDGLRHARALQEASSALEGPLQTFYAQRAEALAEQAQEALAWQEWVQGAERRARVLALGASGLIAGAAAVLALRSGSKSPAPVR